MKIYTGKLIEIIQTIETDQAAWVSCDARAIPAPGQYVMASNLDAPDELLPVPLFLLARKKNGFVTANPVPKSWGIGAEIGLRGPLGKGFRQFTSCNLALVSPGLDLGALTPLATQALDAGAAVVLFTDYPISPDLPASVEVQPLETLSEAWHWAGEVAIQVKASQISNLRQLLKLPGEGRSPRPAQVLVHVPMPCGGIAACGICSLTETRRLRYACTDGPVFDLDQVLV